MDLKALPRAEILIYALSMGFLVYFKEYAPQNIAPMIRSIFNNVLPQQTRIQNNQNQNNNNDE